MPLCYSRGSGLVNSGRAAGAVDGWKRCEALGRRKLGWNGPDYSSEAGCMHAEWARTGDRGPVRVQVAAFMIKISCDNQ